MPLLQATHGRIVNLRRHTNVHLYWRGRYGPAGCEHQFTIHTRTMPARRGHEVTMLTDATAVRGIVNWSTGTSVNYLCVDPPPLLRLRDLWVPPALLSMVTWLGDIGLLILPPVALSYLLAAAMIRYVIRRRRAAVIQRALRDVQRPGSGHRNVARRNGWD